MAAQPGAAAASSALLLVQCNSWRISQQRPSELQLTATLQLKPLSQSISQFERYILFRPWGRGTLTKTCAVPCPGMVILPLVLHACKLGGLVTQRVMRHHAHEQHTYAKGCTSQRSV